MKLSGDPANWTLQDKPTKKTKIKVEQRQKVQIEVAAEISIATKLRDNLQSKYKMNADKNISDALADLELVINSLKKV